jgi:hypothetical protein
MAGRRALVWRSAWVLLGLKLWTASSAGALDLTRGLGVNVHNNSELVGVIRVMGARWVRVDAPWHQIQPQAGAWALAALDASIAHAERHAMQILVNLHGAPAWASGNGRINGVPPRAAWEGFVRALGERYAGRVQAWGVGNEPNMPESWAGTPDQYVDVLLRPAHAILKQADPAALVTGPDLALRYAETVHPKRFLRVLRDRGAAELLDVVTHHAYSCDPKTFGKLLTGFKILGFTYKTGIRQMLTEAGLANKPFWLTEFGCDALRHGEEGQARALVAKLRILRDLPWIENAFVYELVDDARYTERFRRGLLRADSTPRPAVDAIRALIPALR